MLRSLVRGYLRSFDALCSFILMWWDQSGWWRVRPNVRKCRKLLLSVKDSGGELCEEK